MGLFTVELEIGRETRAMIERIAADTRAMVETVAATGAFELELGPQTREVMAHFFESRGNSSVRERIGGLVGKRPADRGIPREARASASGRPRSAAGRPARA